MTKFKTKHKAHALKKTGAAALIIAVVLALVALFGMTACPNNAGGNKPEPTPPPAQTYKVELDHTIGGNVKVTPVLPEDGMAAENTELTFTATPLGGYRLEKWELNGTAVNGTALTYTLKVTANAQVKVFFKRKAGMFPVLHTVTLTPPVHGRVTTVPELPVPPNVPYGSEITFKAVPDAGYAVNKWTVSAGSFLLGGSQGSTSATLKITEDVTVTVTFGNVIFGVDGGHGTLKAEVDGAEIASPAQVEEDKTIVFTASPHEGYMVDTWTITGGQLLAGGNPENTTAMVKITEPITVAVSFKLRPPTTYAVIFGVAGTPPNGSISATYKTGGAAFTSGTAVAENTALVFTASPATDYKVEKWTVNGTAVPGNTSNTYEHTVTEAADIRVSFISSVTIPDTFTLSNGAEYKVVDKAQRHVIMTKRESDAGGAVYTLNVKPEYSGITYTLTGFIISFNDLMYLEAFALSGPSNFFSVEGGVLFDKHKTKLIHYPAGKAGAPYTVPPSVKVLGRYSLSVSDKLTSLILPDGLTTVEDFALYACQKLKMVYIPSSLTSIGSHFLGASKVEDVVIPEGVTELGNQFLDSCSALKTLELPSTFTSHYGAFCTGCTALQTVTCKAVSPPELTSNAFKNVVLAGVTLKVPAASVSAYENAPIWKDFKKPFLTLP
ncbi:leucine-rich repeat domain-containing protein [Treponema denticola]|uniref:InlB B-repeat-containing protein n=1 Tax=Treponema denticola TaxID=158 RepID=UPI0020A42926|nr:leucine-rich repeat protein [Treponema denticola]UTC98302.1 leucine-rich repeat domain-containing protein [Treponema denticola]